MLTPLYDQVLVAPEAMETTTESGLIIPDTAKQQLRKGTIVSMGKGSRMPDGGRYEMDFKIGDLVLVNTRAGVAYIEEGREYRILRDYEILGVLE